MALTRRTHVRRLPHFPLARGPDGAERRVPGGARSRALPRAVAPAVPQEVRADATVCEARPSRHPLADCAQCARERRPPRSRVPRRAFGSSRRGRKARCRCCGASGRALRVPSDRRALSSLRPLPQPDLFLCEAAIRPRGRTQHAHTSLGEQPTRGPLSESSTQPSTISADLT